MTALHRAALVLGAIAVTAADVGFFLSLRWRETNLHTI